MFSVSFSYLFGYELRGHCHGHTYLKNNLHIPNAGTKWLHVRARSWIPRLPPVGCCANSQNNAGAGRAYSTIFLFVKCSQGSLLPSGANNSMLHASSGYQRSEASKLPEVFWLSPDSCTVVCAYSLCVTVILHLHHIFGCDLPTYAMNMTNALLACQY